MQAVLEEHEPGQFVVKLQGELDMATEPVLSDMIREVLSREQVGKLKIDLAGLQFLDSQECGRCCRFGGRPKTGESTWKSPTPVSMWPRCCGWRQWIDCWGSPPEGNRARPVHPTKAKETPGSNRFVGRGAG